MSAWSDEDLAERDAKIAAARAAGTYPPNERSYVERADSATNFDPEMQFDADVEKTADPEQVFESVYWAATESGKSQREARRAGLEAALKLRKP